MRQQDESWGEGTKTVWQSHDIKDPERGKVWHVDLKENKQGLFIKLTERIRGKRDNIVFPTEKGPALRSAIRRAEIEAREYLLKKGGGK